MHVPVRYEKIFAVPAATVIGNPFPSENNKLVKALPVPLAPFEHKHVRHAEE